MREGEINRTLDERGLHEVARGPGVYALACDVPDETYAVREEWTAYHDVIPAEDEIERLAAASAVAYVGASKHVYGRLCDHVAGDVRQASFLQAFDVVELLDVWPTDTPFTSEYNRALELARNEFVVWTDGRLLG